MHRFRLVVALAMVTSCASRQVVHPEQPVIARGSPVPDPPPSRVVFHITVSQEALAAQLDLAIPKEGTGEVELVAGKTLTYRWIRDVMALKFDRGRLVVGTLVSATVSLLGERTFPIKVQIAGEPVITSEYQARIQSAEVDVKADGPMERVNVVIEAKLKETLLGMVENFKIDLKPTLEEANARIARPIELPIPGQNACADLRVSSLEAGPTVLAGGIEKDIGISVLPSVTIPCTSTNNERPALPPLYNVANVPAGPFTAVIPVAAQYEELSKTIDAAIHGRLHFSTEHPDLYLEKPSVFPSNEQLVVRLNLGGFVKGLMGMKTPVEGELFLTGHPEVIDNQITIPDLELTPGSADSLLQLKFALDSKTIRNQAQQALRLDVSERLNLVKDKLTKELSFSDGLGCVKAELLRSEITGIYPHQSFLRIYVTVHAQAGIFIPCR